MFYGSAGRVTSGDVTFADGTTANLARLYEDNATSAANSRISAGIERYFALTHYDWLDAVRRRRAPETSGREGLADLACAYAVLESAQAGRCVEVAEVADGRVEQCQQAVNDRYRIA